MTDAEFQAVVDRIKPLVEKWITPLGLKWWRKIHFDYARHRKDSENSCVADTEVSWEYCEATVTFYVPTINTKEIDDAELEYFIIHEYMHVLVKEMRWQDDNADNRRHEERVCTQLAQAFMWVRDFSKEGKL